MSNVQEALKSALAAIDLYDYTMTVEESEKFAKAERLCKAALSEIEKCEPVAWKWKAKQLDGKILNRVELWNPISQYPEANSENVFDVRELYDKPQPRDWVGLTDKRIEEIAKLNGAWQLYSSLKIFDFVANINDELKQLNMKG